MGSKKRAAWSRQKAEFAASLGGPVARDGMDAAFAREDARRVRRDADAQAARRRKACESKNRYASRSEAEVVIAECAAHGTSGLSAYRCPYCEGWHLTSHPRSN